MIHIFTDGGSRGNPGPAALGVYITDQDGTKIVGFGQTLGITTNNVAEYQAVVAAFTWLLSHQDVLVSHASIRVFADSQLVVLQITGLYRVKHPGLRPLVIKVKELEEKLQKPVTYTHIPREQNKQADRFVNLALDNSQ